MTSWQEFKKSDKPLLCSLLLSTLVFCFMSYCFTVTNTFAKQELLTAEESLKYLVERKNGTIPKFEYRKNYTREQQIKVREAMTAYQEFFIAYQRNFGGKYDWVSITFLALIPLGALYTCIYYRQIRLRNPRHRYYYYGHLLVCLGFVNIAACFL